jgi:hypothetical protein
MARTDIGLAGSRRTRQHRVTRLRAPGSASNAGPEGPPRGAPEVGTRRWRVHADAPVGPGHTSGSAACSRPSG